MWTVPLDQIQTPKQPVFAVNSDDKPEHQPRRNVREISAPGKAVITSARDINSNHGSEVQLSHAGGYWNAAALQDGGQIVRVELRAQLWRVLDCRSTWIAITRRSKRMCC
jgi:hypothetical protein